jgi:uncharacterized membrane protein
MDIMYESHDSARMCPLFTKYDISYVTVEDVRNDPDLPRIDLAYFLQTYTPVFLSQNGRFAIFTAKEMCDK